MGTGALAEKISPQKMSSRLAGYSPGRYEPPLVGFCALPQIDAVTSPASPRRGIPHARKSQPFPGRTGWEREQEERLRDGGDERTRERYGHVGPSPREDWLPKHASMTLHSAHSAACAQKCGPERTSISELDPRSLGGGRTTATSVPPCDSDVKMVNTAFPKERSFRPLKKGPGLVIRPGPPTRTTVLLLGPASMI